MVVRFFGQWKKTIFKWILNDISVWSIVDISLGIRSALLCCYFRSSFFWLFLFPQKFNIFDMKILGQGYQSISFLRLTGIYLGWIEGYTISSYHHTWSMSYKQIFHLSERDPKKSLEKKKSSRIDSQTASKASHSRIPS